MAEKKLFGLFGKRKPQHICGGTTDRTDKDAPKTITSKEITRFQADFYLATRCTEKEEHFFLFEIKTDENDSLLACEANSGISAKADEKLLQGVQQVIDDQKLALKNGEYHVTAGLPPEYQPCTLDVSYASGEKLLFTVNNDPYSLWAEQLYTVFSDWFAEKGDRSLLPPRETSQVNYIRLVVLEDFVQRWYGGITVSDDEAIDGQTFLLQKSVFDFHTKKSDHDNYILFPQDYYRSITAIIDKYDLAMKYDFSRYDRTARDLGSHSRGYFGMGIRPDEDEPDLEGNSVSLHLKYESGRRINIDTKKAGEIKGMQPLLKELLDYHDSLFG